MNIKPELTRKTGKIWIGTSNGQIPGNKLTFPPEFHNKSRLNYYSTQLNSIEVNSCFYKTPLRSTYEKWVNEVPKDFRFTLKLSKAITHAPGLRFDIECANNFLQAAEGIRNNQGCLLIQFPGKISIEHFTQVEEILIQLKLLDPEQKWNKAIEFRNESWYISETSELLNEYNATMVVHDFPKGKLFSIPTKAHFVYLRFHGPTGNYRDSYSDQLLDEKAAWIKELTASGKEVYAYFNNTAGSAFENARYLQALLKDGF